MGEKIPRAKVALGIALKDALHSTPLAKVTVSGLATTAGVNRQTFYSHFSDVYDLAAWVFSTEVADHVLAHASRAEWPNGLATMLLYMREHRDQTYAVVGSLNHNNLEHFFFDSLRPMMSAVVDEVQGDLVVTDTERDFVIDHYTLSVVGHILHWLASEMADDPIELVTKVKFVLNGAARESLARFAALDAARGRTGEKQCDPSTSGSVRR